MDTHPPKRVWRYLLFGIIGLVVVCMLAATVSALVNAVQSTSSTVVDRLSDVSKAHAAEITHLRQALGDQVWPGWDQADIPVLLFNERYAFLSGVTNPPNGWTLPLKTIASGGAWEPVPDDDFYGRPYYRQAVANAGDAIGNFTVRVGSSWALTFETQEWSRIAFRQGFRDELPPVMREVFPYGLVYSQLFGRSDVYLGSLAHEAFHAYQGEAAPGRLIDAERVASLLDRYPWEDEKLVSAWRSELGLLRQALQSSSDSEAAQLASQFLSSREQRRQSTGMNVEMVSVERQREWLEGLAKYAELSLCRAAAITDGYIPSPEMSADPGFHGWSGYRTFYNQQIDQIDKITPAGETWLYYSGMAQAALLDRLMPSWKSRAFEPGVFLEDLLKDAVGM